MNRCFQCTHPVDPDAETEGAITGVAVQLVCERCEDKVATESGIVVAERAEGGDKL